jgi:large subunit ribosomal protein L31e
MGTSDVRVDVALNKFLWSQGVRSVPKRVRVRLDKRHNEDEEAKEKMYTLVSYVPVADFHGLQTKNVEN